jgi:hypothetical protein
VAAGLIIGEGDVAKYRLSVRDGKVVWPALLKQAAPPEDKQAAKPEDKSAAAEPPDDDADDDDDGEAADWPLKVSPKYYLKRNPRGKHADLAARLLGE